MAVQIMAFFIKFSINLVKYFARHGRTPLKFLFWIDDFIRLFTMTILLYLLAIIWKFNTFFTIAFFILGLIIDIHDFISSSGLGKFEVE